MFNSSPKCYDCRHFSSWDMASGGTVGRCALHPEMEQLIRIDLRLWNVTGNWASSFERPESPAVEADDAAESYVCDDETSEAAAIQSWLDSQLVMLENSGPVYRSVSSIEQDILWKFSRCEDYSAASIEARFDDPILFSSGISRRRSDRVDTIMKAESRFINQVVSEFEDLIEDRGC